MPHHSNQEFEKVPLSSTQWEKLWELAIHGMLLVNRDGIILKVNPQFCSLLEYDKSEIIGKPLYHLSHPEDKDLVLEVFNELKKNPNSEDIQFAELRTPIVKRYISKSGNIHWAKLFLDSVHRNEQGEMVVSLGQVLYIPSPAKYIPPALEGPYKPKKQPNFLDNFFEISPKKLLTFVLAIITFVGGFLINREFEYQILKKKVNAIEDLHILDINIESLSPDQEQQLKHLVEQIKSTNPFTSEDSQSPQ